MLLPLHQCFRRLLYIRDQGLPPAEQAALAHIHIHKTAGMYFQQPLLYALRPAVLLDWQSPMQHLEKLLQEEPKENYWLYAGHVDFRAIKRALPDRQLWCIAVIREPLDRVISEYNYFRSAKHPPNAEFFSDFPTIERYLEFYCDARRNQQSHALAGTRRNPRTLWRVLNENYLGIAPLHETEHFRGWLTEAIQHTPDCHPLDDYYHQTPPVVNELTTILHGEAVKKSDISTTWKIRFYSANALDWALFTYVSKQFERTKELVREGKAPLFAEPW